MATYEMPPSGAYTARVGIHDDILMARAIGRNIISTLQHLYINEPHLKLGAAAGVAITSEQSHIMQYMVKIHVIICGNPYFAE